MKVVVGTPFCGRPVDRFVSNIDRLDAPNGVHFIWVDTTGDEEEFYSVLVEKAEEMRFPTTVFRYQQPVARVGNLPASMTYIDPEVHRRKGEAIAAAEEFLRERFLETDGEFLMIVEDDVFPPSHALRKMAQDFSPGVVAVAAVVPTFNNLHNPIAWELEVHPDYLLLTPPPRIYGGLWEVGGASFGCIMIRRDFLESVSFRVGRHYLMHHDVSFSMDVAVRGKRILLDADIWCEHRQMVEKYGSGRAGRRA